MNRKKLLARLLQGAMENIAFADIVSLAAGFGFRVARVSGSHHILVHPGLRELVNLQEIHGNAKSYQVRQLLKLVERYNLDLEDDK